MAYENIRFYKPNMATMDGNFYLLDTNLYVLVQKLSNGEVAFQYPVDIPSSFETPIVDDVVCLQYDGYSFWSLQHLTDNSGVVIRKWLVNNYICTMVKQFQKINIEGIITYDSNTISIEYYTTTLSKDSAGNTYILTLNDYADSVVFKDTVMGLGPNKFGDKELVTVSGTDTTDVYSQQPLIKSYFKDDAVSIVTTIFMFNNYNGVDNSEGSLLMLNPNNGETLSSLADVEYLNINSSRFCRLTGVLQNHEDVHTLGYVNGLNFKLRDMSDLYKYNAITKGNDNFNGLDNDQPDDSKWNITNGNPSIFNNKLFCSTVGAGHDSLESTYKLIGDFDVQISGSLGGLYFYDEVCILRHYMNLTIPEINKNYYLSKSTVGMGSNTYTEYDMSTVYLATYSGTTIVSGILQDFGQGSTPGYINNVGTTVSGHNTEAMVFKGIDSYIDLTSYTLDNNFKNLYFQEDFNTSHSNWRYSNAGRVSHVGFYNSPDFSTYIYGGGSITSRTINTITNCSGLELRAWFRQSDNSINNGPETGDDLYIEYLASDSSWKIIDLLSGSDPYGTIYDNNYDIPPDAYHDYLRLRIRSTGSYTNGDTWYVDDITICDKDYNDNPSEFSMSFWLRPTSIDNYINYNGMSNLFFSTSINTINSIIFSDDFSTDTYWTYTNAAYYGSYTSRYTTNCAHINGNERAITLIDSIDLSMYSSGITLYVWVQNGTDEWCKYCKPESNDYLRVEYYNSSSAWVNLENILGGIALDINERTYLLPADAYHSNFKIRFRAFSNGSGLDYFCVGDVVLYDASYGNIYNSPRPALDLGISASGELQVALNDTQAQVITLGGGITSNDWTHVVLRFDSNIIKATLNNTTYSGTVQNNNIISRQELTSYIGGSNSINEGFIGVMDDVKIYNNILLDREVSILYANTAPQHTIALTDTYHYTTTDIASTTVSGNANLYMLRMHRDGANLSTYYKYNINDDWNLLYLSTIGTLECYVTLGLYSSLITVSGAYFDNFSYNFGTLRYPSPERTYYGIMGMDNVETNQSTILPIYDIDIHGDNLYRLQKRATYYGSDNNWSTYNYQVSPIRSFIDFISIDSDTHILPATGRNTAVINSVTFDQYGQGVVNRPVSFTDDDAVGFITTKTVYTDIFYNTGRANTAYTSGTSLRVVDIEATVTQLD